MSIMSVIVVSLIGGFAVILQEKRDIKKFFSKI